MKKVVFAMAVFLLVVAVLRRFGQPLGERAMEKCQEMLDRRMPERQDLGGQPTEPAVGLAER